MSNNGDCYIDESGAQYCPVETSDRNVDNFIESGKDLDLFPFEVNEENVNIVVSEIYDEYPVLWEYDFKVDITGSKGVHGFPIEYFPPGERDNPYPKENYIGLNQQTSTYSKEE